MTPVDAARDAHNTSNENILLAAASPLLNSIVHIRMAATHDDPAGLRLQLVEEVRLFENRCKRAGLPFETIIGARYCLCSALDEAAAQTPGAFAASGRATACWLPFITKAGAAKNSFSCFPGFRKPLPSIWRCWR